MSITPAIAWGLMGFLIWEGNMNFMSMKVRPAFLAALVAVVLAALLMQGCATTTGDSAVDIPGVNIGNGNVDVIEGAVIRVAVGGFMTAYPASVLPAYTVSSAMLKVFKDEDFLPAMLDAKIDEQITGLDLTSVERASIKDLMGLVVDLTYAQFEKLGIDLTLANGEEPGPVVNVLTQIFEIVQAAAEARMGVRTDADRMEDLIAVNNLVFDPKVPKDVRLRIAVAFTRAHLTEPQRAVVSAMLKGGDADGR